jgi:hypothetical protein
MLFYSYKFKKEKNAMKDNKFATNASGVISAPKNVKNSPKATVKAARNGDLRNGGNSNSKSK